MLGSDDLSPCLNFHVLALLGVLPDGSLDQDKLVTLIRVFRPGRDGTLSIVDFVKSVDAVYRELRLLRASVNNSTKVTRRSLCVSRTTFWQILTDLMVFSDRYGV